MSCIDLVEDIGRRLLGVIEHHHGSTPLSTPDYGWENHRFRSEKFRLAHVEIFNQDRFCVIHCCVFPHINDPAPIYGFDVIAGENKITGVFMDLSPTVLEPKPFLKLDVSHFKNRVAPEWGDIFSPYWLACRPSPDEMEAIGKEAVRLLVHYLSVLGTDLGNRDEIVARQNHYCLQQRQNEHTRKALINLLGTDGANEFMENILFPTIS
jgi:phycocyanobilin:ferredoxin oxidoreductase